MQAELALPKLRFYSSVTVMYAVTLLFVLYCFNPLAWLRPHAAAQNAAAINQPGKPLTLKREIIAGKPNRIVAAKINMDLIVEDGNYNPADQSWTLSGYHAHFAMPSMLANDSAGSTFIYGHNNYYVFARLAELVPGDQVQVFTDEGHTFTYTLQKAEEVKPDDTTIFNYDGPPLLIVQTCSGTWYEKRHLFTFTLDKVNKRVWKIRNI